jgi:hypothetical protein
MPGDGGPVDVPEQHAAARPQRAVQLGERAGDVGHVLEHLDGEGAVEVGVLHGQRGGVALVELDVGMPLGPVRRDRQHRRAGVHADHRAIRPDALEQLGYVEAGSAANVEDALAGRGPERLVYELAPAQEVAPAVDDLHLLRDLLVELELAHGASVALRSVELSRISRCCRPSRAG